jgi:NAD(P)-dependent dehydrogenase (short-subunit alcohol dehydrogenase family)
MTLEEFELVVNVHLLGSAYCTAAVWPIMAEQNYGRIVMTTSPSGLFGNFGQANYGAAKMGVVGMMNTLKIEGQKNNIRINAIAPVAATRMTENLIPQQMLANLGPEKVTPGVVYLCSEDAPSGVILQAMGGRFNIAAVVENSWVELGDNCTVEGVAANWSKITDLTGAKPRGQ